MSIHPLLLVSLICFAVFIASPGEQTLFGVEVDVTHMALLCTIVFLLLWVIYEL